MKKIGTRFSRSLNFRLNNSVDSWGLLKFLESDIMRKMDSMTCLFFLYRIVTQDAHSAEISKKDIAMLRQDISLALSWMMMDSG